jgi:hypothetical protein
VDTKAISLVGRIGPEQLNAHAADSTIPFVYPVATRPVLLFACLLAVGLIVLKTSCAACSKAQSYARASPRTSCFPTAWPLVGSSFGIIGPRSCGLVGDA